VAEIFRRHGPAWRVTNAGHVSLEHLKVMSAIERCRTAALGGHVARCENEACGHTLISYNSCRNRHCPKCQAAASREWLADREAELLPVDYFHLVFTLPAPLRDLARSVEVERLGRAHDRVGRRLVERWHALDLVPAEVLRACRRALGTVPRPLPRHAGSGARREPPPWRAHNRPPHPREIPIARGTPPHLRPRFRALALLERQALRRVARHQREGVREPAQGRTNALSWMVRRTKIQEAPDANKDMRAVVDAAEAAGLAKKVARLAPLICVKG